jgi:uncharacterized protein (TIGR02284 family)
MENEKTIDVLNTLIQINNDRFEGYDTAFKETEEQDLKTLFSQFMLTSQKCKQELVNEVIRLGGVPTESTRMTGKFFRIWMDVKAFITGKDRKNILSSCEFGENIAIKTYQKVLNDDMENLRFDQQTMINAQHALIKADYDTVKSMHDDLVEVS